MDEENLRLNGVRPLRDAPQRHRMQAAMRTCAAVLLTCVLGLAHVPTTEAQGAPLRRALVLKDVGWPPLKVTAHWLCGWRTLSVIDDRALTSQAELGGCLGEPARELTAHLTHGGGHGLAALRDTLGVQNIAGRLANLTAQHQIRRRLTERVIHDAP